MATSVGTTWVGLPNSSEFWSGIIGAVVGAVFGGGISYLVQLSALREARNHRNEDHLRTQRGLANALLFKIVRIHNDFYGISKHIEDCFEVAARERFDGEPWQFYTPFVNFPDLVHFDPSEMGVVIGLKDDDAFNMLLDLDATHNSLVAIVRALSSERSALAESLKADEVNGQVLSGKLDHASYLALRPKMINVNSLIESARVYASKDLAHSYDVLDRLRILFNDRLGLNYKFESKYKPQEADGTAKQS